MDCVPRVIQAVSMPSALRALTRYVYEVLGIRPRSSQVASVVQPELMPAVVFSQRYRVPEGLPLVPHWTWMLVLAIPVNAPRTGTFAAV